MNTLTAIINKHLVLELFFIFYTKMFFLQAVFNS